MPLISPTTFPLAISMLQIEHRIAFGHILVVFRRSLYKTVPDCLTGLAVVVDFSQLAVRHVFQGIEVLILCWDFDIVAPSPRTDNESTARIRYFGTIYDTHA